MRGVSKEVILKWVPCIYYPVKFWKSEETIQAEIDLGSEVNTMTPAYAAVLELKVCSTIIRT